MCKFYLLSPLADTIFDTWNAITILADLYSLPGISWQALVAKITEW
jgi:hypothetical protein